MTMEILSVLEPTTISRTVTTLGCCDISSVLISRSDVIGNPSFSRSIFSLLRATDSLVPCPVDHAVSPLLDPVQTLELLHTSAPGNGGEVRRQVVPWVSRPFPLVGIFVLLLYVHVILDLFDQLLRPVVQ